VSADSQSSKTEQPGESSPPPAHYVILCRHAEAAAATPTKRAPLSRTGRKQAHELGLRLAETLKLDPDIKLVAVWRSSHQAAIEMTDILRTELANEGVQPKEGTHIPTAEECALLDPDVFRPYATRRGSQRKNTSKNAEGETRAEFKVAAALKKVLTENGRSSTVLIVGHQPMLSWLGEVLLSGNRARPFRRGLPVAREVALISIDERWGRATRESRKLEWSIEVSDEKTEDELRAKISRRSTSRSSSLACSSSVSVSCSAHCWTRGS
jgi:broad specificity phosphatase PhoE